MKKFLALAMALVMSLSLVACGSSSSSTSSSSSAPAASGSAPAASGKTGSVYWLNFKPESDEALQGIAKMYTEKTGVPVTVLTAASGTYQETLTAEMDKSNCPTLFVVGNEAAVQTWSDYCYDLNGTPIAGELNTDAYNLYDADGKLCSIGYAYECYGIITNTKLLADAGYSVEDIKDFESFKAVVEDIHARSTELGFDAFTSSGMDGSSSWRFTGHLANMPLYYQNIDSTTATLTTDYLDNFRAIWDLYIKNSKIAPEALATGGFDAEAEFVNGEAVFFQNGSWEYGACSALGDENIQMLPIYCGVAGEENNGLCSGTENCWAVNSEASEENIQATLDFMYWCVTDAEASRILVDSFGAMPYKQAAASTNKFLADANDLANAGKTTVTWAFNYTPNVDEWRAGLVSAMNQYDQDMTDANWETVVTAFVQGWATQYAAVNG